MISPEFGAEHGAKGWKKEDPEKLGSPKPADFDLHDLDLSRPEVREWLLGHLRRVGPHKPLGNLPLSILQKCGSSIAEITTELEQKGVEVKVVKAGFLGPKAVYAFHRRTLQELLQENALILQRLDWPVDVDGFIVKVETTLIEPTDADRLRLYRLIARLFSDLRYYSTPKDHRYKKPEAKGEEDNE